MKGETFEQKRKRLRRALKDALWWLKHFRSLSEDLKNRMPYVKYVYLARIEALREALRRMDATGQIETGMPSLQQVIAEGKARYRRAQKKLREERKQREAWNLRMRSLCRLQHVLRQWPQLAAMYPDILPQCDAKIAELNAKAKRGSSARQSDEWVLTADGFVRQGQSV